MQTRLLHVLIVILALISGIAVALFLIKRAGNEVEEIPVRTDLPQLPHPKSAEGDVPWWRGPFSNGIYPNGPAPTKWSERQNIVWKEPIPGLGHSTPIVVGNRVIVTTARGTEEQLVLALDRTTGQRLWVTTLHTGGIPERKHNDNSYASGTPACDGERIFVQFLNQDPTDRSKTGQVLSALDLEGRILWQRFVGVYSGGNHFGSGPSPIIVDSNVIINGDCGDGGFIAAVNRKTGDIAWKRKRNGVDNCGTPAAGEFDGRKLVFLGGNRALTAYDAVTGEEVWRAKGLGECSGNTPLVGPNFIVASTGYSAAMIAVRPDGESMWKESRKSNLSYCPSMLLHNETMFVVADEGKVHAYDPQSGERRWSATLGDGVWWSSPVLINDTIYTCNRNGTTVLFKADAGRFIKVGENTLENPIFASPVFSNGQLFLRTTTHVYCIGE